MHSFRTFRFRLFMTYLAVTLFFTVVIGTPAYFYLKRNTKDSIAASIEQKALSTFDKFDHFYQIYASVTTQLYMDANISGKSVVQLLEPVATEEEERHRLDQNTLIFNKLSVLTELHKEISRISVFNTSGDVFSNRDYDLAPISNVYSAEELQHIRDLRGVAYFRYEEQDDWTADSSEAVFAFVRQLRIADREIGFMEVQFPADSLLQFADQGKGSAADASLYLFTPSDVIYPLAGGAKAAAIRERLGDFLATSGQDKVRTLAIDGDHAVVVMAEQPPYAVAYAIPEDRLFRPLIWFRNVAIGSVVLLVFFSIVVFYLLSRRLTYPLVRLRQAIDSISLGEKAPDIENEIQANEIEMLNRAFRKMNDRLQQSMEETVHFRTMQLQSHFNTLQAQINPHFLFNMLGVIKALSDRDGNGAVSEVTGKLAQFLQYPLASRSTIVHLADEAQFVRDYLHLMKIRHMHRLEYDITVDSPAETVQLPKLVLQPLVENCIKYGFSPLTPTLRISLRAEVEGRQWKVHVTDNGPGFDADKLAQLQDQISQVSDSIQHNRQLDPLAIGGMGLLSTFVRLKLLYKHHLDFSIYNLPEGGAAIAIRGDFIELLKGE